jgi:aminomuconate-semialdehyde/2-hydroxymuconate-6-semialdehyde dehydrogenase
VGNTVVVKPSEETPATATLLGEVMNAVGVPAGVYNVVHGFGPGSAPASSSPRTRMSTRSRSPARPAPARSSCRPPVGLRDVSMEMRWQERRHRVRRCRHRRGDRGHVRSVFANCGQVCLGTERVYVERPIFDDFVARLGRCGGNMTIGDPDDPNTTWGR